MTENVQTFRHGDTSYCITNDHIVQMAKRLALTRKMSLRDSIIFVSKQEYERAMMKENGTDNSDEIFDEVITGLSERLGLGETEIKAALGEYLKRR